MQYSTRIEVRFGDCDPAGIVYFPVLYHYCHVAFEECWGGPIGMPYATLVGDSRLGFPTVHVESDFESPVRYGDVVTVTVEVVRLGRSSVDFCFEGHVGERRAFRSTHTKVCTDLATLEAAPMSDALRERLSRLSS